MDGIIGRLLVVMAMVESGNNPFAVGDSRRAIGVYQIHRAHWQDSAVPGKWEDCRDPAYARRVVLAYWQRYCPEAVQNGDIEVLSRIHNGGPRGHRKKTTLPYWKKIQVAAKTLKIPLEPEVSETDTVFYGMAAP